MADNDAVLYEKKDKIVYITINRPERMNSLGRDVSEGIARSFTDFDADPDAWIAIITGAGDRAFCAGADLKAAADRGTFDDADRQGWPAPSLSSGSFETWKPIIAAINGYALGGGLELALACDIRVAAEHARLGLPEGRRGRGAGVGTHRLARTIPQGIAKEYLFTGRHMTAQRAYEVGLVNRVVPTNAELIPAAEEIANEILECAPLSTRWQKENLTKGAMLPITEAIKLRVGPDIYHMDDVIEGAKAFAEKRKPVWKGR